MKTLICLLSLLAPLLVIAEDAKMPADAQKIIDKYDKAIAEAKKVYDAAVAKARDQALKELKPIQTAETKKGNLENALLVKGKIEELTAEIPKPAAEGDLSTPISPSIDTAVIAVLGKWLIGGKYPVEFNANGTIRKENKIGKYVVEKGKVIVTWSEGWVDTLRLPKPGTSKMEGTNSSGASVWYEKAEEK